MIVQEWCQNSHHNYVHSANDCNLWFEHVWSIAAALQCDCQRENYLTRAKS